MKKAIAAVSGGLTYWQCYCNDRTWVRQKSDQANQKLKWKSGNSRQRWCWLKKMFTGRWWASGCLDCSLSTIGGCPRLERPSGFEQVLKMEIVVISTLIETAVEDVTRQNVRFVLHRQDVQLFTYHGQLDRMEGIAREDLGVEAGVDHCCLNWFKCTINIVLVSLSFQNWCITITRQ